VLYSPGRYSAPWLRVDGDDVGDFAGDLVV